MNNILLAWQFLRRYPVIPIFILLLLLVAAAIGPYITPYERDIGNIADRHLSLFSTSEHTTVQVSKDDVVNGYHLLGTDHVGRDIFTRLLHGSRISLMVVTISITTGMAFGDHLHLGIYLQGVPVDPVEFWDRKYMNLKIDEPYKIFSSKSSKANNWKW